MAESMGLRIDDPRFWDPADLRREVDRIFDICHSCRLCFKFCGSFPLLFDLIDRRTEANRERHLQENPEISVLALQLREESAAAGPREHEAGIEVAETFGDELPELSAHSRDLTNREVDDVVELCFQCKLCYPNCPYVPPHDWAVDFPRLLLRWKAQRTRREGTSLPDRLLHDPSLVGRASSLLPALARFGTTNRASRVMMEKVLGVHRDKALPPIHDESFPRWWRKNRTRSATPTGPIPVPTPAVEPAESGEIRPPDVPRRVVLFSTCLIDYNDPATGRAAVDVLSHNGIEVAWPEAQQCCGMPRLDGGELDRAAAQSRSNVEVLLPWVERGWAVVVPSPSCSLMLREEVPQIVPSEAARKVAAATFDLCDYLFKLNRAGGVRKDFVRKLGRVRYHVPCHIRQQQIGFRGRDVLRWVATEGVEMVQECSGHDGTWSMKKEHFEESLRRGRKCFEGMKGETGEACSAACSDCALAALQIRQGAGVVALHPVLVLAHAYGFDIGDASKHLESHPVDPPGADA
jgi:glycerol-3-phosphate dehydrogenase subunit C